MKMNRTLALASYAAWTTDIQRNIESGVLLDIKAISDSATTGVGAWLQGEGSEYKHLKEYAALRDAMKKFHRIAARLASRVNSMDHGSAVRAFARNAIQFRAACYLRLAISELFFAIRNQPVATPNPTGQYTLRQPCGAVGLSFQ